MWLNISKGAEYAGVCRQTFSGWLSEGLRHARKGNLVRTKPEWIDEFIEGYEAKQESFDVRKLKII